MTNQELAERARRILIENSFAPEFSPEVIEAASALGAKPPNESSGARDLRALLWSSIDDASSLDLDQIEYAERLENGDIKLLVGVADVDFYVPKDSIIDRFAYRNTVSIYAAHKVFPMLPEELSTDLTSLREGVERLAVVVEMIVREAGDVQTSDVYRAVVLNRAKLSYEEIGAWLDEDAEI